LWHLLSKGESYVWARPALHARKLRDLELKAGIKPNAAKEAQLTLTISKAIAIRSAGGELCTNLGDGMDQAADISWFTTSIPSWNFTPRTILGN
jgi:hypothetical protein